MPSKRNLDSEGSICAPAPDPVLPWPVQGAHAVCPEKTPSHSILAPATLLVILPPPRLWAPKGDRDIISSMINTMPGTYKCLKDICHCGRCYGACCLFEETDLTTENHNKMGKCENRTAHVAKGKEGSNLLENVHRGWDSWLLTRNVNNSQKESVMKKSL